MAKRNSARLVILSRDPTERDDIADLVIHQDVGGVSAWFIAY
jgi:NAD-dependent deacetylase